MMTRFKKSVSFSVFFLVLPVLVSFAKIENSSILLSSKESMAANPFLKKVLESLPANQEKMKIQYLLARIRQSPDVFIRNNESHTGERAAMHVAMKYRKQIEKIKTAKEFIKDAASQSRTSGQPYFVVIDGNYYPLRDILNNELQVLEEKIQEASPKQKQA